LGNEHFELKYIDYANGFKKIADNKYSFGISIFIFFIFIGGLFCLVSFTNYWESFESITFLLSFFWSSINHLHRNFPESNEYFCWFFKWHLIHWNFSQVNLICTTFLQLCLVDPFGDWNLPWFKIELWLGLSLFNPGIPKALDFPDCFWISIDLYQFVSSKLIER